MNIYLLITLAISFSLFITFLVLYFKNINEFSRLVKLRNDFMAMMIHELRSPLSVIKSSADLILKQSARLTEKQISGLLTQIEDSASDLLSIVNDLLDVAKIESGRIEIYKHMVDFRELLELEIATYRSLANEKGLELNFICKDIVGEVNCDAEKIKHVLMNLLSNSIKFTDIGKIEVYLNDFHNYVRVTVSDTGIGVPDEIKSKLFNKFVQARDLPVSREKGTGLGLVIVKGIVEAHGGKVWIEDNNPKGTKFIFTLPKE